MQPWHLCLSYDSVNRSWPGHEGGFAMQIIQGPFLRV